MQQVRLAPYSLIINHKNFNQCSLSIKGLASLVCAKLSNTKFDSIFVSCYISLFTMVNTVDATWLAQRVADLPQHLLVLDTRNAEDYSRGCISGSVHMSCNNMILRRLKNGSFKIESLLNVEEDKAKYAQAKASEDVSVVVCDSSSSSIENLASDSLALLLLNKISRECKHVAFLAGGYEHFFVHYSDMCDMARSTTENLLKKRPSSLVLQLNNLSLAMNNNTNNSVASPMEVTSEEEDSPSIIPPFQILPHLYLGCRKVATCLPGLRQCNVTHILNVTSSIPNQFQALEGFVYKQIEVEDKLDVDMMQHLSGAFQFIEDARANGDKVLVHCHAGRSRSVTIILAYLMKFYNHTLESAHEYVEQRKPDISPNLGFMGQLLDFECSLRPSPADSGFGSSPVEQGHYFLHSPATDIHRSCVLAA